MKDEVKSKIINLSEKAVAFFISYENACQEIAGLLGKEEVSALYQKSDGLVVCVDRVGGAPINIPIEDYLQEIEK